MESSTSQVFDKLSEPHAKAFCGALELLSYAAFTLGLCPSLSPDGINSLKGGGLNGLDELSSSDKRSLRSAAFANWSSASAPPGPVSAFESALKVLAWIHPPTASVSEGLQCRRDNDPLGEYAHYLTLPSLRSWPIFAVRGCFFVLSCGASGAVCISLPPSPSKVYLVVGPTLSLADSLLQLLPPLPSGLVRSVVPPLRSVSLLLLPFRGSLSFDGVLSPHDVSLEPPDDAQLEAMLAVRKAALEDGTVIRTCLEFEAAFTADGGGGLGGGGAVSAASVYEGLCSPDGPQLPVRSSAPRAYRSSNYRLVQKR